MERPEDKIVKEWVDSVEAPLMSAREDQASPKFSPDKYYFYKVSPDVRLQTQKMSAYEPIFCSFGPYHADLSVPSSPSHLFKIQVAQALTSHESFSLLVNQIKDRDSHIRRLYPHPWDHALHLRKPQPLALLLAIDALTIVAPACRSHVIFPYDWGVFLRDACLLEHQLPLFILQAAIASITLKSAKLQLEDVVKFYAIRSTPFQGEDLDRLQHLHQYDWVWQPRAGSEDESMLSQIHQSILMRNANLGRKRVLRMKGLLPSATKLRRCGIRFAACPGTGFTKARFDKTTCSVILPKIEIVDTTESHLLNLLAYEHAAFPYGDDPRPLTSYILLMDGLVDEAEDVNVLREAHIINNQLGSDAELADMWNKLRVNIPYSVLEEDAQVIADVKAACQNKWRTWSAAFVDTYFQKRPWLLVSIIVGFLIFVFTLVQTIYSIIYH